MGQQLIDRFWSLNRIDDMKIVFEYISDRSKLDIIFYILRDADHKYNEEIYSYFKTRLLTYLSEKVIMGTTSNIYSQRTFTYTQLSRDLLARISSFSLHIIEKDVLIIQFDVINLHSL